MTLHEELREEIGIFNFDDDVMAALEIIIPIIERREKESAVGFADWLETISLDLYILTNEKLYEVYLNHLPK